MAISLVKAAKAMLVTFSLVIPNSIRQVNCELLSTEWKKMTIQIKRNNGQLAASWFKLLKMTKTKTPAFIEMG